ncbi:MAG: hypothetical protein JW999_09595 [Methanotrichaceae archaeon]|nr:hypothetical protein [Methanotrichaceae archaeon]
MQICETVSKRPHAITHFSHAYLASSPKSGGSGGGGFGGGGGDGGGAR